MGGSAVHRRRTLPFSACPSGTLIPSIGGLFFLLENAFVALRCTVVASTALCSVVRFGGAEACAGPLHWWCCLPRRPANLRRWTWVLACRHWSPSGLRSWSTALALLPGLSQLRTRSHHHALLVCRWPPLIALWLSSHCRWFGRSCKGHAFCALAAGFQRVDQLRGKRAHLVHLCWAVLCHLPFVAASASTSTAIRQRSLCWQASARFCFDSQAVSCCHVRCWVVNRAFSMSQSMTPPRCAGTVAACFRAACAFSNGLGQWSSTQCRQTDLSLLISVGTHGHGCVEVGSHPLG